MLVMLLSKNNSVGIIYIRIRVSFYCWIKVMIKVVMNVEMDCMIMFNFFEMLDCISLLFDVVC